jgi:hypothetical protein
MTIAHVLVSSEGVCHVGRRPEVGVYRSDGDLPCPLIIAYVYICGWWSHCSVCSPGVGKQVHVD